MMTVGSVATTRTTRTEVWLLCWLCGFVFAMKPALTWVLFSSSPDLGAAAGVAISAALTCVSLFLVILNGGRVRKILVPFASWMAIAYLTWSLVSLAWTGAESVRVASIYWLGGFADMATVLILLSLADARLLCEKYVRGLAIGALSLVLIVFLSNERMGDGRIGNDLLHPNTLGRQLSFSAIACLLMVFSGGQGSISQRFWIAAFAVIVVGLLATLSKTSILAFGMSFIACGLLSKGVRGGYLLLLLVVSGLVILMLPLLEEYLGMYLSSSAGSIETLSGRTDLWEGTWLMIKDRWFLGYGFLSFRDIGPLVFAVRVPHAHNDLLQQWFSLGLVGLLLAVTTYVAAGYRWWRSRALVGGRGAQARVGLALLALLSIRGLTEAEVFGMIFPLPMLLLLLAACTTRERKLRRLSISELRR